MESRITERGGIYGDFAIVVVMQGLLDLGSAELVDIVWFEVY